VRNPENSPYRCEEIGWHSKFSQERKNGQVNDIHEMEKEEGSMPI